MGDAESILAAFDDVTPAVEGRRALEEQSLRIQSTPGVGTKFEVLLDQTAGSRNRLAASSLVDCRQ